MKQLVFVFGFVVAFTCLSGCSSDEGNESDMTNVDSTNVDSTNVDSTNVAPTNPYEGIIGEWKLIKAVPESESCCGYDDFCFYPDGTFKCLHVYDSIECQGKYEIIEHEYNIGLYTVDKSSIMTNYTLLFDDTTNLPMFIFAIYGDIMYIEVPYTYEYIGYKLKRQPDGKSVLNDPLIVE